MSATTSASAATCTAGHHCYGFAQLKVVSPSGFTGVTATFRSSCLAAANYSTEIGTNEVWISRGGNWVEAGITVGPTQGGGFVSSPTTFWAAMRPGLGYAEHYHDAYALGTSMTITITQGSAPDSTNITMLGHLYQSSHDFTYPATTLQAGTESNSDLIHTYGSQSSLGWFDLSGGIHYGWTTSAASSSLIESDPSQVYAMWVSNQHWSRAGEGALC